MRLTRVHNTKAIASYRNDTDVLIAGGGIVGATLASLLAESIPQLTVMLIESRGPVAFNDEYFDPRVIALSAASQTLFERIGIWQQIVQRRHCPYCEMYVWDREGIGKIHFNSDEIHAKALGHIIENSVVLEALYAKISTLPNIVLHRNTTVENFQFIEAQR